jgi:hypothetical protein
MRQEFEGEKDSIEKVLEALGRVAVPEGLEERVLLGMERRVALGSPEFRWKDVLRGPSVGIWWRGAVSGAAVAMLAVAVVMLTGHVLRGRSGQANGADGKHAVVAAGKSLVTEPVMGKLGPCAGPGRVREVAVVGIRSAGVGRVEVARVQAPMRLEIAAAAPLTMEERELVRLARRADVRALGTLTPEAREKAEAEETAQFQSFFAPPPPLPGDEVPEAATGNNE